MSRPLCTARQRSVFSLVAFIVLLVCGPGILVPGAAGSLLWAGRELLPPATSRPAEFAAFGEEFKVPAIDRRGRRLLQTNLGTLDPADPAALLDRVPDALKYGNAELTRFDRGAVRPGLNYARIAATALKAGRGEEVEAAIGQAALGGPLPAEP